MNYLYLLSIQVLVTTITGFQLNQVHTGHNSTDLTKMPGALSTSLNVTAIADTMQYIFPALSRLLLFHKSFNAGLSLDIKPDYRLDVDKLVVESVSGPKQTIIE